MRKFLEKIIPFVGIELNITPGLHFIRDILFTILLWQIGFRDFQACLAVMLISGFYEVGQGLSYRSDGSHNFFDFLDFLPSVIAGFLVVSIMTNNSNYMLLAKLIILYIGIVLLLILLNIIMGREIIIKIRSKYKGGIHTST